MLQLLKLVFRLCIVMASGWGLSIMLGITAGHVDFSTLVFYTMLSNVGIFFAYSGLLIAGIVQSIRTRRFCAIDYPPVVMGGLMAMIVLTGIIYNFVLAPTLHIDIQYAINKLSNFLAHTLVPLMVLFDWLLFADNKKVKWWHPFIWTIIPLAYFIFAVLRAQYGGPIMGNSRYPYFFIDIDAYGVVAILRNAIAIIGAFLAISYGLIGIGRLSSRVKVIYCGKCIRRNKHKRKEKK